MSMLQQLRAWLTSPDTSTVYTASDLRAYLRLTLGIGIGLSVCAGVGLYLLHDPGWDRFLLTATLFVGVTLALLFLLGRVPLRRITYALVGAYGLVFVIGAITGTGVRGTAYSGLTLAVMLAGLFLGRRATLATALFSMLFGLGLILANALGWLVNIQRPLSEIATWLNLSVYFILAALMLNFALRQIEGALAQARRELAERECAQAEVRRLNADLERRVAERTAQLAESEARYRLITDNASDVIWITDLNLRLTYISPSVERTRGYTPAEALRQSPEQALTPESLQRALAAYAEELERAGRVEAAYTRTLDLEYYCKAGHTTWSEVKVSFLRDETGQPVGLIGVERDITDRRAAQAALRESEARLQLALEAARLGTWMHDFKNDQTFFSERMRAIYGEQVPADSVDFIHPADQPQVRQTLGRVLQNQRTEFALTYRVVLPDGQLRWIESWGQAAYDATGQPQSLTGVARDVTERMQIEEALRASENRFSQIFEASPAAMLILSETKGVTDVNEAFLRLVGCARAEVMGPGWRSLNWAIGPRADEQVVDWLARLGPERDFAFRRQSGEAGFASLSAQAIDLEGEQRFVVSFLDITDRKQAEMVLQHRTQRLETLSMIGRAILRRQSSADIAREALTYLHRLTGADRASVVMFDFERQEARMLAVVGVGEALWPPGMTLDFNALTTVLALREEQYAPDIVALETRSPFLERLLADGLRCALTLPLLPDENVMGRVHLTAFQTDAFDPEARAMAREVADMLAVALQQARLHEQVQHYANDLEQRVLERTAQLQAANEELEAFSYSVSHDLRAPLRGIDGFSRLLLEEYAPQLEAEGHRYLSRIRENAQGMGRLIDHLLHFSRLGRQPIAKQMVNMTALAQQALAELRPAVDGRQVELILADLPAGWADPTLLRQVFVNLLGNAFKYSHQRTPARIEVGWREGAYYVRDNGVGFDMRYVAKLFGVFQRLHHADEFEGTGVGLANVKRIIERHGGRIWAEAAPDQGATFYFTLADA